MVYFTYACKLVIPWSASLSLFNLLLAFLTVLLWDVIHMTCYLHKRHEEWHVVLLIVQWMRWRYLVYLLGALSVQKMFTVLSRIYIYIYIYWSNSQIWDKIFVICLIPNYDCLNWMLIIWIRCMLLKTNWTVISQEHLDIWTVRCLYELPEQIIYFNTTILVLFSWYLI